MYFIIIWLPWLLIIIRRFWLDYTGLVRGINTDFSHFKLVSLSVYPFSVAVNFQSLKRL